MPSYNVSSSADASVPDHVMSIASLNHPDHHDTIADYYNQIQRPLPSSAFTYPNGLFPEQLDDGVHEGHFPNLPYQPMDGNVSHSQLLDQSSTPSASSEPRPVASQHDPLQADISKSKSPDPDVIKLRRQRNSAAARKYRQKRLDRIEELEQALQEMQTERDELKVQVARWKGRAEVLQSMVASSGEGRVEGRG